MTLVPMDWLRACITQKSQELKELNLSEPIVIIGPKILLKIYFLVFFSTGQSGCFISKIGQKYILQDYKSNTIDKIKI